jgi:hypothetical protein
MPRHADSLIALGHLLVFPGKVQLSCQIAFVCPATQPVPDVLN